VAGAPPPQPITVMRISESRIILIAAILCSRFLLDLVVQPGLPDWASAILFFREKIPFLRKLRLLREGRENTLAHDRIFAGL
jgi:hypothetical protein